jgi:hypothetical protein
LKSLPSGKDVVVLVVVVRIPHQDVHFQEPEHPLGSGATAVVYRGSVTLEGGRFAMAGLKVFRGTGGIPSVESAKIMQAAEAEVKVRAVWSGVGCVDVGVGAGFE